MKSLEQYKKAQQNLVWAAVRLLRPGGILVYSTCTIDPKENEEIVAHVLNQYKNMELLPAKDHVPQYGEPGLPNFGLSSSQASLVLRFDPTGDFDTIGFFCAKFRKLRVEVTDVLK